MLVDEGIMIDLSIACVEENECLTNAGVVGKQVVLDDVRDCIMLNEHEWISHGGIAYQFVSLEKHRILPETVGITLEDNDESLVSAEHVVGKRNLGVTNDVSNGFRHHEDPSVATPKLAHFVRIVHDEILNDIFAKNGADAGSGDENGIARIIDLVLTVEEAVFDNMQAFGEIGLIVEKHIEFRRFIGTRCVVLQYETANSNVGHPAANLAWLIWK